MVAVYPLRVAPSLPRDRDGLDAAGRVEIWLEAGVARKHDALPCGAPDAGAVRCLEAVDACDERGQPLSGMVAAPENAPSPIDEHPPHDSMEKEVSRLVIGKRG